jgi:glycosyltransferase involved in cell wall biosynthesis
MISGIDPKEDSIGSVPVSLSPEIPERKEWKSDPEFVFSGIFWPWQNPFPALNAVIEMLNQKQRGYLKIYGGQHPYWKEFKIKYPNPEQELLKSNRIVYSDLIFHEQLMQELFSVSVAVDLMAKNNERILAFPIRTVCYLWNGVPVIIGNYSDVSKLVAEYQAGWVLDPNDTAGIQRVVEQIFDQPELVKQYSQNAQKLVREKLTWDKTIEPLHQFCLNPRKLAKQESMLKRVAERAFRLQYEMGTVYGQRDEIQRQLDETRQEKDRVVQEKDKVTTERNELAISLANIRNKPLFKFYKVLKSIITLERFRKK